MECSWVNVALLRVVQQKFDGGHTRPKNPPASVEMTCVRFQCLEQSESNA